MIALNPKTGYGAAGQSQIASRGGLPFMTLRSLALFAHILGMLALFVALAIEWTALALLRKEDQARPSSFGLNLLRQLPRLTGLAIALILASGTEMAAQFGLLRSAWVGVSSSAVVLIGRVGGPAP